MGIGKYVIKKVIYTIGNTIPLLSAMTVTTKTKAPETRD